MEHKNYKPVGRCIYCGTTDGKLSREHIIPYAMNGRMVLPSASCAKCATVTSAFERELSRTELHQMRAASRFQSRKNNYPTAFPLVFTRNGVEEIIDVAIEDHPIFVPLPLFPAPAYITPYEYWKGIAVSGVFLLYLGADPDELKRRYQADKVGATLRLDHNAFARLLAKIAYSFAVAELGIDRIKVCHVLNTIYGVMHDAGRWIGSSDKALDAEPGLEHRLQLGIYKQAIAGEADIVIVLIRPFANRPGPGYSVIVGEIG